MRSDERLPQEFRDKSQWIVDPDSGQSKPEFERLDSYGPEFHRHSYSGYERNKLFLNQRGESFADISGISGADEIADSRSWVKWDYDRDGWQDIAVVNANKPLLSLFRSQMAQSGLGKHRMIAVGFQGASDLAQPSAGRAPRDGYGAKVRIKIGDNELVREHRCGEGYAAQNSTTMLVGIGAASTVAVSVVWPSGRMQGPVEVSAGQLIKWFEDPSHAPGQQPYVLRPYIKSASGREPR